MNARFADYVELAKPKIAAMALVTVAVGYLLGAAPYFQVEYFLHTLVGAGVVAAGGSALNHWLERLTDSRMRRTSNRPLPAGRIQPISVLVYGLALGIGGIVYLAYALPTPAAAIAAGLTFLLYVWVYTPLKRITTWNTIVGAVPGALPPVIGWCAAQGEMSAPGWGLFAILFVWQLPHFYSIAWLHREDYARGGMRMLPVVDHADGRLTGTATAATAVLLLLASAAPYFLSSAGIVYLVGSVLISLWFLARCVRFARDRNDRTARTVLRGSLVHLLAVMSLFVADGVIPRYFIS